MRWPFLAPWSLAFLIPGTALSAQVATPGLAISMEQVTSGRSSSSSDPGFGFLATLGIRMPEGLSVSGGFRYVRSPYGGRNFVLGALVFHTQQVFTRSRVRPFVGARMGPGFYGIDSFGDPTGVMDLGVEAGLELGLREVGVQLRLGASRPYIEDQGGWMFGLGLAVTRRGPAGY